MLLRLSELLFIEVVRRHLETLTGEHTGWLAGLRDPMAGHALALLHNRPADPWSLERLAREICTGSAIGGAPGWAGWDCGYRGSTRT